MKAAAGRVTSWIPPGAVFLWSLGFILSQSFPHLPAGYDSAYYLILAKGFATGHPYLDFSSPDAGAGALLGPSCFPLLLSLYWRFLHPHLFLLKAAMALATALAPVGAFLWMCRLLPASIAFLASLAYGASFMFIVIGNTFMTECVYAPMLHFAVWLSLKGFATGGRAGMPPASQGGGGPEGGTAAWAAMPLWVAMARTRVVGWAGLCVFVALALKRRRFGMAAAGMALAGAWVGVERLMARGVHVARYTDTAFTTTYPILVDFWKGVRVLLANVQDNALSFATAIDAHLLFPFFYNLVGMNRPKRLACLAIFLWTAWGAWMSVRKRAALRPWLLTVALSSLPTFIIYTPNDSFRYHMPYLPFLFLFFLEPFSWLAERRPASGWRHAPLAAALALALGQAVNVPGNNFDHHFIEYPRDFDALHDSLLAAPGRPGVVLSPMAYYTYLRTGIPSLFIQDRYGPAYMREHSRGREVWAICGPRNDYFCERCAAEGMVFGNPPLRQVGPWKLFKVEGWPADSSGAGMIRD